MIKKSKKSKKNQIIINVDLLQPLLRDFSGAELKTYLWLAISTRNGKAACHDTLVELAEHTGLTSQTVFVSLKKLCREYVDRKSGSAKKPTIRLVKTLT